MSIFLGGTASANELETYEEGTWTPSVEGFSTIQQQPTEWTGFYTKIGQQVFLDFYLRFENGGSTTSNGGNIALTNLPFNIKNVGRMRGGGLISFHNINGCSQAGIWSWYGHQNDNKATAYVGTNSVTGPNGTNQEGRYIIGTFIYST